MRFACLLALYLCAEVGALAQPNGVGFTVQFNSGSQTSGNGAAIGGCVEATHDTFTDLVVLRGQTCYDNGDKLYVGDGYNIKWRGEGHAYFWHDASTVRPFAVAGINSSKQFNSEFSKGLINPYVGWGVNYKDKAIIQMEYLLPERRTLNNVSALRVGGYYFYQFAPRWSVKLGGEWTSTLFTQPTGTAAGKYRANSFQAYVGLLWTRNKASQHALRAVPDADRMRPMSPPRFAMQYVGVGDYRLTVPFGEFE